MASLSTSLSSAPEDYQAIAAARMNARRFQSMNVEADMSIGENSDRQVYTSKKISDTAFLAFEEFRRDKLLCDVTLRVGDQEFKAHRVVLAATCPYFRGMFTGG